MALVQALPDAPRLVFNLYIMEGYTHMKIAEALKTSEVNVRQIVSRGIKRLRELIDDGGKS